MSDIYRMDVTSFIEKHGGTKAVAARLKVARTTVSDWKRLGWLPASRAVQIQSAYDMSFQDVLAMTQQTGVEASA